jgi:hypothetical protein
LVTATSVDRRGLPCLRQCAVKTFALDAGGLGDFGDALGLREMAQRNEQNTGLVFIFQRGLEVLGSKIGSLRSRRMMASSCETLALRFMRFRSSL